MNLFLFTFTFKVKHFSTAGCLLEYYTETKSIHRMKYRNCVCAHVSDVLYENPNRMTAVLISLLHGYKSWASMDEEFSDERMCTTRAYRKRRTKEVYEQKRNWKVAHFKEIWRNHHLRLSLYGIPKLIVLCTTLEGRLLV